MSLHQLNTSFGVYNTARTALSEGSSTAGVGPVQDPTGLGASNTDTVESARASQQHLGPQSKAASPAQKRANVRRSLVGRITRGVRNAAAGMAIGLAAFGGVGEPVPAQQAPARAEATENIKRMEPRATNVQSVRSTEAAVRAAQAHGPGIYLVGGGPFEVGLPNGGSVELTRGSIEEFDKWLAQNAPNYTFFFYRHSDEAPQPVRGTNGWRPGEEAELYPHLVNDARFQRIVHPVTKEPMANFATFVVDGKARDATGGRRLRIFASPSYDDRGYGDRFFTANFDRTFYPYVMRREVFDGLKKSVQVLDENLELAIGREIAKRNQIRSSINNAETLVGTLAGSISALQRAFPSMTGDLISQKVVEDLKIDVTKARNQFDSENYQLASSTVEGIITKINARKRMIDDYPHAEARVFKPIDEKIDHARSFAEGGTDFERAIELLTEARHAHTDGRSEYRTKADQAEAVIDSVIATHEWTVLLLTLLGGALSVALAGGLIFSFARRKGAEAKAKAAYDTMYKVVRKTGELIRKQHDRLEALGIGDSLAAADAFDGKSREFGKQLVKQMLKLTNLRREEDAALDVIQDHMFPKGFFASVVAKFTAGRYKEAQKMLEDAVIRAPKEFKADGDTNGDGLPDDVKTFVNATLKELADGLKGKKWAMADLDRDVRSLLGEMTSNIDYLVEAVANAETSYDTLSEQAAELLKKGRTLLPAALAEEHRDEAASLFARLDELRAQNVTEGAELEATLGRLRELRREVSDGLFMVPHVESEAIPKAGQLLETGNALAGNKDPIAAKEEAFDPARRIVNEAEQVVDLASDLRHIMLPRVREAQGRISVDTQWLDKELAAISQRTWDIGDNIVEGSQKEAIAAVQSDRRALRERAYAVAQEDERRIGPAPKSIADATTSVHEAQTEIAKLVNAFAPKGTPATEPERVLRERNNIPLNFLQEAQEHLDAAKPFIVKGDPKGADEKMDMTDALVVQANDVVQKSLNLARTHATRSEALSGELTAILDGEIPVHQDILAHLESVYARDAWSDVAGTVKQAERTQNSGVKSLEVSNKQFLALRVLAAGGSLDDTHHAVTEARQLLGTVSGRKAHLEQLDANNAKEMKQLFKRGGAVSGLLSSAEDSRTLDDTKDAAYRVVKKLENLRGKIAEHGRNPIKVAEAIAELKQAMANTSARISEQHRAYDRAKRKINEARNWSTSEFGVSSPSVSRATRLLREGDYEGAYRAADREIDRADSEASRLRSARLAREAAERRRREAEAAAARRRRQSSYSSSSSSSRSWGSSGGGSFGGFGGGSSGGGSW